MFRFIFAIVFLALDVHSQNSHVFQCTQKSSYSIGSFCYVENVNGDFSRTQVRFNAIKDPVMVQFVTISNVNLGRVPESIVTDFPALEELELRNCGIQSIENIRLPPSLRTLDVGHNKIWKLPTQVPHISHLNAPHNQIREIPVTFFRQNLNIWNVNFGENKISDVPEGFLSDTKVSHLNLEGNQVSNIENRFSHLPSLLTLDLTRNQVSRITRGTFRDSTRISTLDLAFNQIETIDPEAFATNRELKILELDSNRLTRFEIRLPGPELWKIDVSNNQIVDFELIPSSAGTKMNLIAAENNRIVSPRFGDGLSIEKVIFDQNQLSNLNGISKLEDVFVLSVANNPLNNVNPEDIKNFPRLNWLNISDCGLSYGQIYDMINGTRRLNTLDVSYNEVFLHAWTIFPQISGIQSLHMNGCGLSHINLYELKYAFPSLKSINLSNNAFKCGYLSDLIEISYRLNINLKGDERSLPVDVSQRHQIRCED